MKVSLVVFSIVAIYGAFKESEASEAWTVLHNPQKYLGFPEFKFSEQCAYNGIDVSLDYRRAIYDFVIELYKRVAVSTNFQAVFSPVSIWMNLAAMAEGMDGPAQQELFKVLNLPEDRCHRQKFYQLAAGREISDSDVTLLSTRVLAYDENLHLNKYWNTYVRSNCLMNTFPVPIKRDPVGAESLMRNLISSRLPIGDFSGNSALLDSLDFEGLWTYAFSDTIEDAPFYNDIGQLIGTVELMKMKKCVRMGYIPELKFKVLELPVGHNGRYRMLLGLSLESTQKTIEMFKNSVVFDIENSLRSSRTPIDIAIPRFTMEFEHDWRPILQDMGVNIMWTDAYATRNISEPAAKPSAMIHRVTISMDHSGIYPSIEELPSFYSTSGSDFDTETGLDPILGHDFIANRPFMFGLVEADTYTPLFTSVFARPTNRFLIKK